MFDWIPDSFFGWYWIVWLVIGFGIPEAIALARRAEGDTLSEHVRKWFATEPGASGKFVTLRRVVLLGAMAWLSIHWITDGTFI